MNTRTLIPITATAICAAALVGCEWGGVHSGESWNDAYSWANFTGTYKLVSTIDAASESGSGSSSSSSSTETSTTVTTTNYPSTTWSGSYTGNKTYQTNRQHLRPGSVNITVAGLEGSFSDKSGVMAYSGATANSADVDYATGAITITLVNESYFAGKKPKISMMAEKIEVTTTTTRNGTTTTTTTSGDSSKTTKKSVPITWLNLTQKGNLLTFVDNNGVTYSGKITGASCPTADQSGYVQAGHIRFTFEATSTANSAVTLSGSLSGDWSGASSETTGTIANRTIDATYHNGRSATQFQAVSGTTTVYARAVTPVAGVTE